LGNSKGYVSSQPSTVVRYCRVATPAFSITISNLSKSLSAICQWRLNPIIPRCVNALTLSNLERSSSQHSTTFFATFVVLVISSTALFPFSRFRHARINFLGLNLARWRAASSPRPTFAPDISGLLSDGKTCNDDNTVGEICF
jgi:hypothetical protein